MSKKSDVISYSQSYPHYPQQKEVDKMVFIISKEEITKKNKIQQKILLNKINLCVISKILNK